MLIEKRFPKTYGRCDQCSKYCAVKIYCPKHSYCDICASIKTTEDPQYDKDGFCLICGDATTVYKAYVQKHVYDEKTAAHRIMSAAQIGEDRLHQLNIVSRQLELSSQEFIQFRKEQESLIKKIREECQITVEKSLTENKQLKETQAKFTEYLSNKQLLSDFYLTSYSEQFATFIKQQQI